MEWQIKVVAQRDLDRELKLPLAMAAVSKSEGQQDTPLAKQRIRKLVEAIREKVKEEYAGN